MVAEIFSLSLSLEFRDSILINTVRSEYDIRDRSEIEKAAPLICPICLGDYVSKDYGVIKTT